MGQASELRGSPEGNWPINLEESKPSSLEQAGTSYRGLCMCCTVLLPFWLMAHLEQEGMDMGGTVLQGTAAIGKNNVCGRLYSLLYCRDLENSTNEMSQSKRRKNRTAQRGGSRKKLDEKETDNGKLVMVGEESNKK